MKVDILVATDVAARGIDVEDVTHVINHRVPEDEKTYLHRTGRTGRAGNEGTAVTFVDWEDISRWKLINDALELGAPDPVETYSSSEHLFYDLNIPAGTKGRLPRSEQTLEGLDAERLEDYGDSPRGARSSSRGSGRGSRGRGGSGSRGAGSRSHAARDEKPGQDSGKKRQRRRTRRVEGESAQDREGKRAEREKSVESTGSGKRRRRRRRQGSNGAGSGAPAAGGE